MDVLALLAMLTRLYRAEAAKYCREGLGEEVHRQVLHITVLQTALTDL
jgi:hypothetical protein